MISETSIIVRYAETDQMGIVHHASYPVWYECARTDLIKKIGMTYTEMERMGLIVPLLELHSRYIAPAFYEDELVVRAKMVSASNVKLEFQYCIYKKGEETPINTGSTLHALVGKDRKPINIKRVYPDLYEMLQRAVEREH